MYVIRDIFHLKFGQYREAKLLADEYVANLQTSDAGRILTDFTGDSYRLIWESSYNSLADYEEHLQEMAAPEWQEWYAKFKQHVHSSHREILKQVI